MLTVSESGLYSLIFRSRKPQARAFSKWVRAEVLPTLRKTESYTVQGIHAPRASSKVGRHASMPMEMPADALSLRPAMRQRLWRDALDTARLEGAGLEVALEWFGNLCRLMAAAPPEPDSRVQKVRTFFAECCVAAPGSRVRARDLYEAMRHWHRGKSGDMPTMRIFGETMSVIAPRLRSNGMFYRDISFRNQ